jgi:hypothetical protein
LVFADLVDSTPLSTRVEPETRRLVVGRYRELVVRVVTGYEAERFPRRSGRPHRRVRREQVLLATRIVQGSAQFVQMGTLAAGNAKSGGQIGAAAIGIGTGSRAEVQQFRFPARYFVIAAQRDCHVKLCAGFRVTTDRQRRSEGAV